MKILVTTIFILSCLYGNSQWNENAGLIPSLLEKSTISSSSGANYQALIDGNMDTYWESSNPLPTGYLVDKRLNVMRNSEAYLVSPKGASLALAVDGNTDTKAAIVSKVISFQFLKPEKVSWVHLKINTNEPVTIVMKTKSQQQQIVYSNTESYQVKSIELNPADPLLGISLMCNSPYDLFELGMIADNPVEFLVFDMGQPQKVGWISTRHFNGDGVSDINLLGSSDGKNWSPISALHPQATAFIPIIIQPEIVIRYLKVEFALLQRPYQKAMLMEIAAYDRFGPYGPPPKAKPATKSFSESMGINAFWGWGYSVYSDLLKDNQGPYFFFQAANLVRNYHRIDWDIDNPQQTPAFNHEKTGGNLSGSQWMNWDREYVLWKKVGFTIDAVITFDKTSFSDKVWLNPLSEAKNYGFAFATHFVTNKAFISSIEIGNEPWEYNGAIYQDVLKGMSSGMKKADPAVPIFPCAVQAYDRGLSLNNYISKYVTPQSGLLVDGLNTHIYSYIFVEDGKRRAINPEDARSEVWSMNNLSRFRDVNMPGKQLVVTEFGYDSEGGGEDCTHDECITEQEQAFYGTRMALMLYRLGADAFYWYFFANVDYLSMLHNRSGLTSSYSGGFAPKSSFFAFKKLKEKLGHLYFNKVVMENSTAYVYAFADSTGKVKMLIAWRPTSENHDKALWINIPFKARNVKAEYLISAESDAEEIPSYSMQTSVIRMALSGNPVLITVVD